MQQIKKEAINRRESIERARRVEDRSSAYSPLQILECLDALLGDGISITPDGRMFETKHLVASQNGFSFYVYADDHNPPHFHVRKGSLNASFTLEDCSLLAGNPDSRDCKKVKLWFRRFKVDLDKKWNELNELRIRE